eukprot:TRINITY_DN57537_c0_g1_i1.p1 TRINITY_DN57537_c0_g1~~TRINITY_DN57537_c0_g1_i1.p1  ORF type:complete len:439 (-),score=57.44 TRINITY_DN57537_c0_g1_i1:156-1472(-)
MSETYVAPIVAVCLVVIRGIYAANRAMEARGYRVPHWGQYYTWLYLLSFCLFLDTGFQMIKILRDTSWLDSNVTAAIVEERFKADAHFGQNISSRLLEWEEDASLDGHACLRWMSIASPVWVLATFIFCVCHTWKHVQAIAIAKGRGTRCVAPMEVELHHKVIFILSLPMFYSQMAARSVVRMFQVVINHVGNDTDQMFLNAEERKAFLQQMFEANFCVADIYEALALLAFGNVVMVVLKQKFISLTTLERERIIVVQMGNSIERLALAGVHLFAGAWLVQGAYFLGVTTMGYLRWGNRWFSIDIANPGFFQTPVMKVYTDGCFSGMGFVASAAAISNLFFLEVSFTTLLAEFGTKQKFWAVKILVTVSYMQMTGLAYVNPMLEFSETHGYLWYASMLCFECFVLSLLHGLAWRPKETWYTRCEHSAEDNDFIELAER